MLSDKLHYLSRVASYVVFCGSLPRDVENDWYADAIHDLTRRGIKCVLDCEGEPLRAGCRGRAVPRHPEPAGGREPRRAGVHGRGGLRDGARHDRRPRRAQRPHHAGDRVLRARARGAAGAALPRLDPARRADRAGRRRGRAPRPATCPSASTAARSETRCGRPSAARPRRSSSSAPDASTRARLPASPPGSRSSSSLPGRGLSQLLSRPRARGGGRCVVVLRPDEPAVARAQGRRQLSPVCTSLPRWPAARGDVAQQAADAVDDQLGRSRRAAAPRSGRPATLPSFVPSVAENQEIRSWGPANVVRTASTLELSAIAIGIPCTIGWPSTSPVAASTMGSDVVGGRRGTAALDDRRRDVRDAPARCGELERGLCSGQRRDAVRVTRRIPPSAIFCLHEPLREAAGRVDVLDVVPRVGERPARSRDAAEPLAGAVARVGEASTVRSDPPKEAAMTSSNGEGPLSWSVQRAVDMRDATASCDCPSVRSQPQVMLPDEGCGRVRSCLPGARMCTTLHAFLLAVNHAATPLFSRDRRDRPARALAQGVRGRTSRDRRAGEQEKSSGSDEDPHGGGR